MKNYLTESWLRFFAFEVTSLCFSFIDEEVSRDFSPVDMQIVLSEVTFPTGRLNPSIVRRTTTGEGGQGGWLTWHTRGDRRVVGATFSLARAFSLRCPAPPLFPSIFPSPSSPSGLKALSPVGLEREREKEKE